MAPPETVTHINNPAKIVPAIGPSDASIMLVGEAPGKDESRLGEPFIGTSGRLLMDMLRSVGLMRHDLYITNVVKEQPHKNNITPFVNLGRKHPVESDRYKIYVEGLKKEINDVQPNVIVAVGNVALWALCGLKGVKKWRGSVLESTLVPGVKVIPIIHPAAALRMYLFRHYIMFDLKRVVEEAKTPTIPVDEAEYILAPSFHDCIEYLNRCLAANYVAFDIEVASGEVSCISFSCDTESAISIPLTDGNKDYFPVPQAMQIWRTIGEVLESDKTNIIAHNARFDASFLFRKYGIRTSNLHDTMVGHAILYPDFPKGLGFVTSIYTTMPYYKDEGKKVIRYKDGHPGSGTQEEFWLYNAKDSIALTRAFPRIYKQLSEQGNLDTYNRQRALLEPFIYMSERGVRMDLDGLKNKSGDAQKELEKITALIQDIVGYEINPGSTHQLKDYFYDVKGLKPYISRSTGNPTTDKTALKRLARNRNEEVASVARLVARYRELQKADGTYYSADLDKDGRLRCSINVVGTKFGRVSSSKTIFGTGMNMQNQPREMKRYMTPDPGYIAYEMDLSQAENRVVAYIAGDENMIEAFDSGADIHSLTGASVARAFGHDLTPADVKEMEKLYKQTKDSQYASPIGSGLYTWRDWGKKANHGLNYGMMASKAGLLWEVSSKIAGVVVERYHNTYPAVRRWHDRIRSQLKTRTLTNLFGRRVMFLDRWDQNLFLAAYSFIPQSTVADAMNQWGVRTLYERDDLQDAEFIMQVHDSVVFQIPLGIGFSEHARIIKEMQASLEQTLTTEDGREFFIPTDLKILPKNFLEGQELRPSDLTSPQLADRIKDAYTQSKAQTA